RVERAGVLRREVLDLELPGARGLLAVERGRRYVEVEVVGRAALAVPRHELRAGRRGQRDLEVADERVRDVRLQRERRDVAGAGHRIRRRDAAGAVIRDLLR